MNPRDNIFLRIFGRHNTMRVLDYFVGLPADCTAADICEGTSLTSKTVKDVLDVLRAERIVVITRKAGNARLYALDHDDPVVKALLALHAAVLTRAERDMKEAP